MRDQTHLNPIVYPTLMFLVLAVCGGCLLPLPSGFISSFALSPDRECQDIANSLNLGALRAASIPTDVGLSFEPFTATSANGQTLAGWFIPAQFNGVVEADPQGTVLITHGTDGAIPCALPWAAVAANNRMHAVVFDYQGFGDSGGSPDIATLLDDSEAVLDFILSDASPARQKVHLLGISLGTGPALGLAILKSRPQLQTILLDSAYDPVQIFDAITSSIGFFFPTLGSSAQSGFPWLFETRMRLGEMMLPAQLIHGELDGITPLTGARTVHDNLGATAKSLAIFTGRTHVQALFLNEFNFVSLAVTFWRNPTATPNSLAAATDLTIQIPVIR